MSQPGLGIVHRLKAEGVTWLNAQDAQQIAGCAALRVVWKVGYETLTLKFITQNSKSNNSDFRIPTSEFKDI